MSKLNTINKIHKKFSFRKKINFVNIFLFIGVLFLSVQSFAQNLKNESCIIEYLGGEKYSKFVLEHPDYLEFLDVRCSDGYHVIDYVEGKMDDFQVLETITYGEWVTIEDNGKSSLEFVVTQVTPESFVLDFESEDFNFLKYTFAFSRKDVVYHVLGNTGKVIMMIPIESINEIVNKTK